MLKSCVFPRIPACSMMKSELEARIMDLCVGRKDKLAASLKDEAEPGHTVAQGNSRSQLLVVNLVRASQTASGPSFLRHLLPTSRWACGSSRNHPVPFHIQHVKGLVLSSVLEGGLILVTSVGVFRCLKTWSLASCFSSPMALLSSTEAPGVLVLLILRFSHPSCQCDYIPVLCSTLAGGATREVTAQSG
ncbi:hypothetical protein HJG60_011833 [Phyllostomus discolor]|uniref:Uncharacterized protein n=1 Tax=Phyllostomus discolor TaxID=89673 RepID=A0A834DSR3_9CHIR|nr:hypothetical protein HJG60_011833 [Phyllostomus discolor]